MVKVPEGVATVELMLTPELTCVEPPELEKTTLIGVRQRSQKG